MQKETVDRSSPRPGGRSARVQKAVHRAVRELQADGGKGELTVPAVAARAGVTPSTIYRRWGTLSRLLSDVALERLRPGIDRKFRSSGYGARSQMGLAMNRPADL